MSKQDIKLSVEEMEKAGVNLGHKVSKLHPKMKQYVSGVKNNVHLFDLEKTAKELSQKREKNVQERSSLRAELDRISNEIRKSEGDMKNSGANLFENRHKLQEKLSVLSEKKKNINTELIDLAAARSPLLLLEKMLS